MFFVVSGMQVDIDWIIHNPARLAVFFVLLLVVRGLSVFLVFRSRLPGREPVQLALFAATGLPLIVAITEIGRSTGVMLPENAAALVGAGLLSVLIFPMLGSAIGERRDTDPGPEPEPNPTPSPSAPLP